MTNFTFDCWKVFLKCKKPHPAMLAGQFTNCSAHQILNHTFDPACRGSVALGHPITEEMTQGSAVSNSRQRLHPVLFLRVKHEEQAAPCWGRLRTSTPGFPGRLLFLSYFLLITAQFHLGEPDSMSESLNLYYVFISSALTAWRMSLCLGNYGVESGADTNHSTCSLTQHGSMVSNFSF